MNILRHSLDLFINVLSWLIIIRGILSFIIDDYYNPIFKIIYQLTEPIIAPFRNLVSRLRIDTGMIDISPLLAIIFLSLIRSII
ncbi:hypothetical protein CLPU_5c00290 [Gottschalkia purinilytica]|uniref:YggT family protein n=1 Tax=Gottschalkia purinilytica TaxID=1503 RepID=A0A0L0WBA8_GOTPU|nr:YggT family protein [Gottschalkia purinilytica]KNF08722.1 hypothetical protein CLPU_5c00290 [Gottschalkia purinilytica]